MCTTACPRNDWIVPGITDLSVLISFLWGRVVEKYPQFFNIIFGHTIHFQSVLSVSCGFLVCYVLIVFSTDSRVFFQKFINVCVVIAKIRSTSIDHITKLFNNIKYLFCINIYSLIFNLYNIKWFRNNWVNTRLTYTSLTFYQFFL